MHTTSLVWRDQLILAQPCRPKRPMLVQCWADVVDGGLTLTRHWVNVSCLLEVTTSAVEVISPSPAPMAHSYRLGLVTQGYQVRIPVGTDICHRGCAYTVYQTVQRHGVYCATYGTVHYKEPLKSFEIRVGHSTGFRLPSVAILPWLCRKRRKAIFIWSVHHAVTSYHSIH